MPITKNIYLPFKKYLLNSVKLGIALAFVVFSGCSFDEETRNTNVGTFRLFEMPAASKLRLVQYPDQKVVYRDFLTEQLGITTNSKVTAIKEFLGNLFFLIPEDSKIIVASLDSLKKIAEIDFSATKGTPVDICFANSTDAYVCLENSDEISIVDLTSFLSAKLIKVGKNPCKAVAIGGRVFVANYSDATVSVIEINMRTVSNTINVRPCPISVDASNDGAKLIVTCRGNGKDDSNITRTSAVAQFYGFSSLELLAEKELGTSSIKAANVNPRAATVSARNYAFFATDNALMRINASTYDKASASLKGDFHFVMYNFWRDELMILKSNGSTSEIITADPNNGSKTFTRTVSDSLICIFPIK